MTDGSCSNRYDVLADIRKRDQVVQLNVAHAKRTQEERDRSVLLGVVDDLLADGATFAGLPDHVVHGAAGFGATALGLSAWTADRENCALRYQLWLAQQEIEVYKARAQNAWRIGDACEVRMGGAQWIPGRIVDIGNNPVVGEWAFIHVPSEGKTVPRSTKDDSDCFRRGCASEREPRSCDECEDGVVYEEHCPTCSQGIPRSCVACTTPEGP